MITHIATTAVYVADQAAAERFWCDQVGFTVHRRMPMGPRGDWLEIGPPDAATRLVLYPKAAMDDWAERKPSLVFTCADLHATHEAMAARGVPFSQEPTEMPWGRVARGPEAPFWE